MEIGSKEWKHLITKGVAAINIDLEEEHADQFAIHAAELIKWNQKINLTAITDPIEIVNKHFVDSIACAPFIPPGSSLLDIGSGGGFPGIPLKIVIPSLSASLIDSSRKKVSFLNHVIRTLCLQNIKAIHIRAEEFAPQKPQAFDVVISRALSALDTFVSLALPLVSEQGIIVALKGKASKSEIDAVYALQKKYPVNFSITVNPYKLPGDGSERSIICIRAKRESMYVNNFGIN